MGDVNMADVGILVAVVVIFMTFCIRRIRSSFSSDSETDETPMPAKSKPTKAQASKPRPAKKPKQIDEDRWEKAEVPVKNKGPQIPSRGKPKEKSVPPPTHARYTNSLKGFTDDITDICFSSNCKCLAATCADRTVRVFYSLSDGKAHRGNIDFDHGTSCAFSSDSKYLFVGLDTARSVQAYTYNSKPKEGEKALTPKFTFDGVCHDGGVMSIGVHPASSFVITSGGHDDTEIKVWTPKGTELCKFNTRSSRNYMSCLSSDGRLVGFGAWTTDVKLLSVELDRSGVAQSVVKAIDLKGHRSSVMAVAFSDDCQRVATCSKDGCWKVWRIDVRWREGEDAKLVSEYKSTDSEVSCYSRVALSPHGKMLVVSSRSTVQVFDVESAKLVDVIREAHAGDVLRVVMRADGLSFATAGADKRIHLWKLCDQPGKM